MCIGNGQLRAARDVYEETLRQDIAPHLHAYNCLINAYATHFRLGDVVRWRQRSQPRWKCGHRMGIATQQGVARQESNGEGDHSISGPDQFDVMPAMHNAGPILSTLAMRLSALLTDGFEIGVRQVRVVTDMVEGGLAPDEATYAGILHACQRANEAELAFDVLRCRKTCPPP